MTNNNFFSELCCLFCCPPCPGKIAAKLAFLPPEPTYAFTPDETGSKFALTLTDRAEWQYSEREKENIEGFYSRTSRGNRIACLFVRCSANARFTILFSHGNAVDLGQMSSFYLGLGTRINCNIFSYDYSGYGVSGGKPSEKNLYADIDAAWQALRTRYGISPENVILYGQSIGTVPTVDLAARYEVGAVVLHSPLMSGMRVAFPNTKRTWFFDAFPSIDKIPKVTSPVLVIHGTEDEVIDFSHGLAIYERCPRAVEPLWVEGAGHNDVELFNQYLERLKRLRKLQVMTKTRPHVHKEDIDSKDKAEPASPPAAHNISINVTDADSPCGVRRRAHLRSLSDVTPAARSTATRARSHSERPRASPAPSPCPSPLHPASARASPAPGLAPLAPSPRAVRSARASPEPTRDPFDEPADAPPRPRRGNRFRSDTVTVLGDPWRKMSDVDLRGGGARAQASLDSARAGDPWVKNAPDRAASRSRDDLTRTASESEPKRDGTFRRGKLERKAAIVCESCGNESCECWRPRSPGNPRTPRRAVAGTGAGVAAVGARCTCEAGGGGRSPRPSPARLAPRQPVRAMSDDERKPRRLYKSSSQKMICTSMDNDNVKKPADPLLETTC
ncbi:serine aminopeptidase, s33 domain-containing protein [Phthorimaea operculella]|nr:serine aminopeptidase, s33 domain-containing protein [Phthorimaea operculella]